MSRFLVQRVCAGLFTIWFTASLTFFALRILPGDAIAAQFAQSGASSAVIKARRDQLGLDEPLAVQYIEFWVKALQGDLGISLYGGQTVSEILSQRIPTTIQLAIPGILIAIGLGLVLGIISHLDIAFATKISDFSIDISISMPIYWSGTLLLFVVAPWVGGQRNILLPISLLGFHSAGAIARILRVNLDDVARYATHVQLAKGKGLSRSHVFRQHIFRVAIGAAIPVIGIQAGILLSGTVITETLFQHAGVGQMLWNATLERNYPVIQGGVIFVTCAYVIINVIADAGIYLSDPRIKASV